MIKSTPKGWRLLASGNDGMRLIHRAKDLRVIASWGGGWDRVSVSKGGGVTPNYKDMRKVHADFFPGEVAVEYHMPLSKHVSPGTEIPAALGLKGVNVLHLWRPHNQEYPLPPVGMV